MIIDFRYSVANKIDGCVLWRVLIYLSLVMRTSEGRSFVVNIGQDHCYLRRYRRRRNYSRYFFNGDFQNECTFDIFLGFSIELSSCKNQTGSGIDIEQISRSLSDTVGNFVVDSFIAISSTNWRIKKLIHLFSIFILLQY